MNAELTPVTPPEFLYFATDGDSFDEAFKCGLNGKRGKLITLYDSEDKARKEVKKRQLCFLFTIIAEVMADQGYKFYRSESGDWLTEKVPSRYMRIS